MWGGLDAMSGNTPHWLKGERYQHFGARAYDPVTCIFMQIDPMAEKYYGMTPYHYCAGNPMIFVDPEGQEKIRCIPKDHKLLNASIDAYKDDKAVHIFAHGTHSHFTSMDDKWIDDEKSFTSFMSENSKSWQDLKDDERVVVLHSCFGSYFVQMLSSYDSYKAVIFVGASGYVHVDRDTKEESVIYDRDAPYDMNNAALWIIYQNGEQVGSLEGLDRPSCETIMSIINDKNTQKDEDND